MGLVSFKAGGGIITTGYKPSSITNLTIKRSQKTAALTWTDPEDFTIDDTPCVWARTILIRKAGSAPESIHDGTEIAVITERNKHTESPWVDGVLELDVTYYYAVYVVSTDGLISDLSNIVSIMIPTSKIMTVVLDLNDSNPETCGSYADDAVSMPYGKTAEAITAWQEFFRYRPCLFKDGKVVGYLNPDDYSKFENGEKADITSGNAGYVMVEFPRRGVKISKTGKIITISMTDDPDDSEFTYYAHTRGDNRREYFYLGAYFSKHIDAEDSTVWNRKYRAICVSGVSAITNVILVYNTLDAFRSAAHDNGPGYELMTWYQHVYLQVMYTLQFRGNLDSESLLHGYYSIGTTSKQVTSGTGNKGGLIGSDDSTYMKLFGIENLWADDDTVLDGIIIDSNGNVYTATDAFNDNHTGYIKQARVQDFLEYITNVYGTSELGFFPINDDSRDGSDSTYFCNRAWIYPDDTDNQTFAVYGIDRLERGIFDISIEQLDDGPGVKRAVRLSYY